MYGVYISMIGVDLEVAQEQFILKGQWKKSFWNKFYNEGVRKKSFMGQKEATESLILTSLNN